jgi:hypothetical protein
MDRIGDDARLSRRTQRTIRALERDVRRIDRMRAGRHIAYPRHDKGGLEHHSLQAAFAS